jgi:hypothetical protein
MSILANQMSAADTAVEVLTIPTGRRTTFNINAVNTGSEVSTVTLYAASRDAVRVTSIALTDGGTNYVAIPDVTLEGGGGTGATATARMIADSMTLVDAGTGYAVGDALSVAVTDQTAAVITVTDVDGAGAIQAAELTSGGDYAVLPDSPAPVTGGSGTGATFVLTFAVLSLTLINPGTGFSEPPTVSFSSGTATGETGIDIVLEPKHTFEHAIALNPGGILYRTALILGPGDRLYAQADTDTVALTAWGVSALI